METLLQHFLGAITKEADIEQLKKLILQIAFKGNLVGQSLNDEPVSVLLERIQEEKKRLVQEKEIKREKPLLPVTQAEIPYQIPHNWVWERLGNCILYLIGGGTPPKNNPQYWHGDIPWASVKDLKNDMYLERTVDTITDAGLLNSSSNLIKKGNIIISTRMGLGKIQLNTIDVAINQDLKAVFLLNSSMLREYFYYYYKSLEIKGTGTTVAGIKQDQLLNILMPIPPIDEQKKIVRRIEDLFGLCDRLQKAIRRQEHDSLVMNRSVFNRVQDYNNPLQLEDLKFVIENMEYLCNTKEDIGLLRDSVLSLAVQGKLIEQDTSDEPAGILLEKIKLEKEQLIKEKKLKKEKPLPQITDKEQPFKLPKGWKWVWLGDILHSTDAGKSPKCIDRPAKEDEWGVIKTTAIQKDKFIEVQNKVLPEGFKISDSYIIKRGDVLITRAGPKNRVGIVCCVDTIVTNLILSDKTVRISLPNNFIFNKYISLALNSPVLRGFIESKMTGMAESQVNISQNNMRLFCIPLPPLVEQKRIVEKVHQLTVLCDEVEKGIEQSERERTKLLRAVLQDTFKVKEEILN
ncbi:restriction endonuclease subunit S [Bacillus paramycoides]|uniref:restriction endonuclease subunit S n=1 Tax=Bacillus paramycoides TaxID=2026194 RepID=UPI0015BB9C96|nr:restriction endonuclease subunit S [Bacillus paramycoides]NWK71143.1 restriction endonuclease subunit S [Bacillus paramycoides]